MKRYVYYMIIISLILICTGVLLIKPNNNMETVNTAMMTKSLKSNYVNTVSIKEIRRKKIAQRRALEKKKQEQKIQARMVSESNVVLKSKNVNAKTLKTGNGRASFYGLDCAGCSGQVGSGKRIVNGSFYKDPKFGYVRGLAAGPEFSYGTIIRISGTGLGTFTGIVLDRGGAIGAGRRFLFDILVGTEANAYKYGVSNIKYEVLRYGY